MIAKHLSVLITREDNAQTWWVGQVLETDLASQAHSLPEILEEMKRIVIAHIESCTERNIPVLEVPPAPAEFQDAFDRLSPYHSCTFGVGQYSVFMSFRVRQ